jgi:hypothetical protein
MRSLQTLLMYNTQLQVGRVVGGGLAYQQCVLPCFVVMFGTYSTSAGTHKACRVGAQCPFTYQLISGSRPALLTWKGTA